MLGDGLACWDFDHCLKDGQLVKDVPMPDNYVFAEVSSSGTGLHVFVFSDEPSFKMPGVEFYSHSRFIRMTGVRYHL